MLALTFAAVLVFCIWGMYRLAGRTPSNRWSWPRVWRLACLIAVLRITALWLGMTGLRRPDWLQIPAYLALMLDLPEIYLIKSTRAEPYHWAILGSAILAATSIAWAAVFFAVWTRLSVKPETTPKTPFS